LEGTRSTFIRAEDYGSKVKSSIAKSSVKAIEKAPHAMGGFQAQNEVQVL